MSSSIRASHRRRRLLKVLRAAQLSLCVWDDSLRQAAPRSPNASAETDRHAEGVLTLLADSRQALDRRLAELGAVFEKENVSEANVGVPVPAAGMEPESYYWLCVQACRTCGRALGVAFNEALAEADEMSARTLYGSLRAFEKHIWLLDPRPDR